MAQTGPNAQLYDANGNPVVVEQANSIMLEIRDELRMIRHLLEFMTDEQVREEDIET